MEKTLVRKERYTEASGGRKTSSARARLFTKQVGSITVNGKDYKQYFALPRHQIAVFAPFQEMSVADKVSAVVTVRGGGLTGQAEATRNAIAKALVKFNAEFRKRLRTIGYLTRDARMVERKHYGKKKARKSPQWSKR